MCYVVAYRTPMGEWSIDCVFMDCMRAQRYADEMNHMHPNLRFVSVPRELH